MEVDPRLAVCQRCWAELVPSRLVGPPPRLCPSCEGTGGPEGDLGGADIDPRLDDLMTDPLWRCGPLLVADRYEAPFPEACAKCNAPTGYTLHRRLYWHHPAIYLTLLLGIIGYVIAALATRKEAVLYVPLCDVHRSRRRTVLGTAWGLLAFGLAALFGAAPADSSVLAFAGLGLLVAALVVGMLASRTVLVPVKIDQEYATLKGAGPEFLARLPEFGQRV